MDDKQYLRRKLETLRQVDDTNARKPHHIPVNTYVEEADALYIWARTDKERLMEMGLAGELLEDIPARAGALREAQSLWMVERMDKFETEKQWEKEYPEAVELYNELVSIYRFAFRKEPGRLKSLKALSRKRTLPFFIQGLNDLGFIGTQADYEPLLTAVRFDRSLAERAVEMADRLAELSGRQSADRSPETSGLVLRNQAYTHLKEAVDQVREFGQYVFKKDKDRLVGYRSAHIRKQTVRRVNKGREEKETKKRAEAKETG